MYPAPSEDEAGSGLLRAIAGWCAITAGRTIAAAGAGISSDHACLLNEVWGVGFSYLLTDEGAKHYTSTTEPPSGRLAVPPIPKEHLNSVHGTRCSIMDQVWIGLQKLGEVQEFFNYYPTPRLDALNVIRPCVVVAAMR